MKHTANIWITTGMQWIFGSEDVRNRKNERLKKHGILHDFRKISSRIKHEEDCETCHYCTKEYEKQKKREKQISSELRSPNNGKLELFLFQYIEERISPNYRFSRFQ